MIHRLLIAESIWCLDANFVETQRKKRRENGPITQTLIFEIRKWNCSRVMIPRITTLSSRAHNYVAVCFLLEKAPSIIFQSFVSTQSNTSKSLIEYSFIAKEHTILQISKGGLEY